MSQPNSLAQVAALLGERARGEMVLALMSGRALTAKELAYLAGITPQTASEHLSKLVGAQMLTLTRQGRFHYFRLASPAVARTVESMMSVVPVAGREFFADFGIEVCGRYRLTTKAEKLAQRYHARMADDLQVRPSWNAAPGQDVLAVRLNPGNGRALAGRAALGPDSLLGTILTTETNAIIKESARPDAGDSAGGLPPRLAG